MYLHVYTCTYIVHLLYSIHVVSIRVNMYMYMYKYMYNVYIQRKLYMCV